MMYAHQGGALEAVFEEHTEENDSETNNRIVHCLSIRWKKDRIKFQVLHLLSCFD